MIFEIGDEIISPSGLLGKVIGFDEHYKVIAEFYLKDGTSFKDTFLSNGATDTMWDPPEQRIKIKNKFNNKGEI